ncbi:MAG: VOC family protein [Pseudomonadota bacterium]
MLPQRLTMVTLGVRDLARSDAFYRQLGFQPADFDSESVRFFDMNGVVLGLYGHNELAEDATVDAAGEGFRGVALALNLESEQAVDAALAFASECGADIKKPAERVFWGGYSGYFADPDGHLWEVAFNPHSPLDENGRMTLPPPVAD